MLHKWFDATHEQHNIWNKLKAAIEDACLTSLPALLWCNTTYAKPSNTMDVDTICVNMLMVEEKEKLSKKGCCFKCKKQGHISHKCPKREEKKDAPRHENQGMTMCAAVVEEDEEQSRVEELAGGIRALADEENNGLLNLLMEKGF